MNNYAFLGIVHQGMFVPLVSETDADGRFRLTASATGGPNDDAEEISLAQHEGRAILVRGILRDEWIVAATIVDEASPITTVLVQVLFAPPVDPRIAAKVTFPL